MRGLDLRIKEKDAQIQKDKAEQAALAKKNKAEQQQCDQFSAQISTAEIRLKELGQYLADYAMDEQLVAELTGLRMLLDRLTALDQQHSISAIAREKAEHQVDTAQQTWKKRMASCSAAEKRNGRH